MRLAGRLAALLAVALVAGALVVPLIARRAIGRRIQAAAAARGLSARWAALGVRFPARVVISRLRVTDAARGSLVFRGESLAVAVDPLSVALLRPRARRIELRHALLYPPRGRGADPDTLAPEEDPARPDRSDRVRRAGETLVRALLVPARRLPRIELRDVRLETGDETGEPGARVHLDWLDLGPARDGVTLAGGGWVALEDVVPFSFRARYGNDDQLQGGATLGIRDTATGLEDPLRLAVAGRLVQDRGEGTVEIDGPTRLSVGRVPLLVTARLERKGSGVELDIACDGLTQERVVASLPRPLLGPLLDVGLSGSWDWRLHFSLDVSDPEHADLHADVTPHGLALDPARTRLNLLSLDQPFTAEIHLPHGRGAIRDLSPANPHYRPLEAIDSILVHAVLANEDGGFFRHGGLDPDAIEGAIADNIRAGRYHRGAGTITMQLVRNLYLGHERRLSRKVQEVALAWALEHLTWVSKRRLLEIYLNVLEWGPGIHGAGEAAQYYFARDPSRLSVDQTLFLSTVIPAPRKWRHRLDSAGALRPFARAQMHFIGRAMVRKGWLSAADLPPADSLQVEITGPARELLFPREEAKPDSSAT